jgi:hypothetical protein
MAGDMLSASFAAGIAALRTIVDASPDVEHRRRLTNDILSEHLPPPLTYLRGGREIAVFPCPVKLGPRARSRYGVMKSTISEITLPASPNASPGVLDSVLWTQTAVDIADAVFTAVASGAIAIVQGATGRGKTIVAYSVLRALGMRCTRINLAPTTSAEDLFGREIPQAAPEGGFSTQSIPGPLTLAMSRSCDDTDDQAVPSQAILLDNINLASPQLLELALCPGTSTVFGQTINVPIEYRFP